ncbi:MAG: hypothetical protein ABEI54_05265 [Candidatus Bipolaricaulia bacterium]
MPELPEFIEERDVTWLVSSDFTGDRHAVFFETENQYFQVEIIPENYPGLGLWLDKTRKDPIELIRWHYDGWFVRKNRIGFELPVDKEGYIDFEED